MNPMFLPAQQIVRQIKIGRPYLHFPPSPSLVVFSFKSPMKVVVGVEIPLPYARCMSLDPNMLA